MCNLDCRLFIHRGILDLLCFWTGLLMAASFKVCPMIMSTLFVSTSPSRLSFLITFSLNCLLFVAMFPGVSLGGKALANCLPVNTTLSDTFLLIFRPTFSIK